MIKCCKICTDIRRGCNISESSFFLSPLALGDTCLASVEEPRRRHCIRGVGVEVKKKMLQRESIEFRNRFIFTP